MPETQALKASIRSLYDEHQKNTFTGVDGFVHDLSLLIEEALHDGFNGAELVESIESYTDEVKALTHSS